MDAITLLTKHIFQLDQNIYKKCQHDTVWVTQQLLEVSHKEVASWDDPTINLLLHIEHFTTNDYAKKLLSKYIDYYDRE